MRLLAKGMTNKEIGRDLHISEDTVKTHVSRILAKLGAHSRTQAVLHAMRMGLVDADAGGG
ncbi:MAG: response regulator transcription factor [Chloroflexi bacterium]|nr:MAG: response regulator transcription factor [Chloroflexota bacterium]